jgi:hypothetical protein
VFHYNFLLGEEFHGIHPLAVQVTIEAFLPPAEGKERLRRGHADVDADVASLDLSGICIAEPSEVNWLACKDSK